MPVNLTDWSFKPSCKTSLSYFWIILNCLVQILFYPAPTLLWPLHALYLCITMNLQSHRGSYTVLTFITIILIPVFPLFDSVSGGVYTFFLLLSLSLSILDRLNWKGPLGIWRLRVLFHLHSHPPPPQLRNPRFPPFGFAPSHSSVSCSVLSQKHTVFDWKLLSGI